MGRRNKGGIISDELRDLNCGGLGDQSTAGTVETGVPAAAGDHSGSGEKGPVALPCDRGDEN